MGASLLSCGRTSQVLITWVAGTDLGSSILELPSGRHVDTASPDCSGGYVPLSWL